MKTPEEIKKGLEYCNEEHEDCKGCTYFDDEDYEMKCLDSVMVDALAYIQQLEETVARYKERHKRLLETASILSDAVDELEQEG